jgi:hypothetical protein
MARCYILNPDHSVRPVDVETWAHWFDDNHGSDLHVVAFPALAKVT